jgi:hypothetical protein
MKEGQNQELKRYFLFTVTRAKKERHSRPLSSLPLVALTPHPSSLTNLKLQISNNTQIPNSKRLVLSA